MRPQEPYLFGMALRAIGNLTRCDENIARVVGFGVIKGIVEGMTANAEISGVIQLAADVMGNLGSLDDEDTGEGVATGARVLKEGLEWRKVCVPLLSISMLCCRPGDSWAVCMSGVSK